MIKFLPHKDIDKEKWDRCIAESEHGRIFAYSWFLDLICPGWDGLVADDYETLFPLTWGRKLGVYYLYQPFFTQQLGVFSRSIPDITMTNELLRSIPARYRYIDICLNSSNNPTTGQFQVFTEKTYELNLTGSYEELSLNYSDNAKRNIKKAIDHKITVTHGNQPDELIAMFRSSLGKHYPKIKSQHYSQLRSIMTEGIERNVGEIYTAKTASGLICASAYFIYSNQRHIFLFSGNTPESRENGSMFLLVDQFISDHTRKDSFLDFMGSKRESLARFYMGFGSREASYPRIKSNRLPWPLRLVKR